MSSTVISYPIPPYSNVPIQPEFYQPRKFVIQSIILGETTTVTTTLDNNYVIGQLVRLLIPPTFGTRQLNEQTAYVIAKPNDDEVVLNISSNGMDAFISDTARTKAQIVAVGDINQGQTNSSGRNNNLTYIPGSFINISPL